MGPITQATQVPDPVSFTIEVEFGTLFVSDLSKPLWHGSYYTGTLSIYPCIIECNSNTTEEMLPGGDTYVVIYSLPNNQDFITYASYESNMSHAAVAEHLQKIVHNIYIAQYPQEVNVNVAPHNNTIH